RPEPRRGVRPQGGVRSGRLRVGLHRHRTGDGRRQQLPPAAPDRRRAHHGPGAREQAVGGGGGARDRARRATAAGGRLPRGGMGPGQGAGGRADVELRAREAPAAGDLGQRPGGPARARSRRPVPRRLEPRRPRGRDGLPGEAPSALRGGLRVAYADVLFLGSVLTMDPAMPRASAAAVRAGKVLAVGSATQLHELAGPDTRVVELGRGCLLPGFHDAHLHLTQYGLEATQLDLSRTPTFDAALELLATRAGALGPEEPLLATGMALNIWGLETIGRAEADALEAAVGGRTTLISSQDHHSNWASGAVLAAAGVRDDTPDPPEGVIVRDDSGRATGLLLEKAQALADDALPAPTRAELRRALQDAGASLA